MKVVAKYMDKVLSPVSNFLTVIGMIAMCTVVLVVVIDICMRAFLSSSLKGSYDIEILGFSIVAFFPMALTALEDRHVTLTFVVEKMPRIPRLIIETIMLLATTVMLGLATWRLCMYGISLQEMGATMSLIKVPTAPFLYLATASFAVMTLVFLSKTFLSIHKFSREP